MKEGKNEVKLNEGQNIIFAHKNPSMEDVGIYEDEKLKYTKNDFKNRLMLMNKLTLAINVINYSKGIDYYKENKKQKIKKNGNNDFMIENENNEINEINENQDENNNISLENEKENNSNNDKDVEKYNDSGKKKDFGNNNKTDDEENEQEINDDNENNEENGEINGIIKNDDYNNVDSEKKIIITIMIMTIKKMNLIIKIVILMKKMKMPTF